MSSSKFWTPVRAVFTVSVLALVAALSFSSCNSTEPGVSNANTNASNTRTNAPAAPRGPVALPASIMDAPLKTMDGKAFKLSDSAGKVLIINLWATWCGPCRMEIPELVKLSEEYKDKGVEVIGLDVSPERDSEEEVQAFMRDFKMSYKIAFVESELARALVSGSSGAIPQNLVITPDGKLLKRYVGYSPTLPSKLRQHIEDSLNAKTE